MLHVEKGSGADFRANPDQDCTLRAYVASADKFRKRLRHAIHTPNTHLKVDVEPGLFSLVHLWKWRPYGSS